MSLDVLNFDGLVEKIQQTHFALQEQSVKAVNIGLTSRNWLIGFYIVEFEQNGEDRAIYGDKLIYNLSQKMAIRGLSETNLKNSRLFYLAYSEIRQLMTDQFIQKDVIPQISQLVTDEIMPDDKNLNYYKQNMMEKGDNLPVGILLVTDKNTALVEYATANEKDRLFVSKYKLNLPSENELKAFIENELRKESEL